MRAFLVKVHSKKVYLFLAFLLGFIPSVSFIHIFAKDFVGYYTLSESFSRYGQYSFAEVLSYGSLEAGLQARAPFLPLLLSLCRLIFGNITFSIYLPILIFRLLAIPLAFLVSSLFLPLGVAFLASSMMLFFPKLQTYSLAAFEADGLVLVLYLLAILLYYKYKKTYSGLYLYFCGGSLGLLALSKETGFPVSVGFAAAVLFEFIMDKKTVIVEKIGNLSKIIIPYILLSAPFFIYTYLKEGGLYFSGVTADRNLKYIPENLSFLFLSIPSYIGLENLSSPILSLKSFIVNSTLVFLTLLGSVHSFMKKDLVLIFPTIFTIFALGSLNSAALGGKIPGNFELITILAFVMPIVAILIFRGLLAVGEIIVWKFKILKKYRNFLLFSLSLILMLKFVNNFFSKPYTLDYSGDYYINLKTIIFDKKQLPAYSFEENPDGYLLVKDLSPLISFMKSEYRAEKVAVFNKQFQFMLTSLVLFSIIYTFLNYAQIKRRK